MTKFRSKLTLDSIKPFMGQTKTRGKQVVGDCPVCGKTGHLYAKQDGDKLLVFCHKCNAKGEDIIKAFVSKGAVGEEVTETERRDHHYKNPDGTLAYQKIGAKYSNGSKEFKFVEGREDGTIIEKKPEGSISLYNLPALQNAYPETVLYIVEGEKKVDAMTDHGLLATCSCFGAKEKVKFTATEQELLDKFKIKVVIPDNDEAGEKYIKAWPDAYVLRMTNFWPDCPNKGDVADYFAQGGTVEGIIKFKFAEPVELTDEYLQSMNGYADVVKLANFEAVYRHQDQLERQFALGKLEEAAKRGKCLRQFNAAWKSFLSSKAKLMGPDRGKNKSKADNQPLEIFTGQWTVNNKGISKLVSDPNGNQRVEVICHTPLMPVELLSNIEDGTQKVRIMYRKDGIWKGTTVARELLANNNKVVNLSSYGIAVDSNNAKHIVSYMTDAIAMNENDILSKRDSVSHFGWAKDSSVFIPYCEEIALDCGTENESLVSAMTEKGMLQEWIDFAKPLRANIPFRVALCASFASPLIEMLGILPFVVHIWGGTGNGKTVALMVAASVWGNPNGGKMLRTMNMTVNAAMNILSTLRNIPLCGDELQTIKSRFSNYDNFIMKICEGIDRGRMDDRVKLQNQRQWFNSSIFTGEEPISQRNSGGGVQNRLIEIEAEGKIVDDGHKVSEFVRKHFGTAGKEFIEQLPDKETLNEGYRRYLQDVLNRVDTSDKQAMAMAAIALADELTSSMLFEDAQADPETLYKFCKLNTEIDPAERAYAMIIDWIGEEWLKFDGNNDKYSSMYGRLHDDTCDIIQSVLERQLREFGFDFNAVKKRWAELGYLVKRQGGSRYTERTSIDGQIVMTATLKIPKL